MLARGRQQVLKVLYISENANAYKAQGRAYDIDLIPELKKKVSLVVYTTDKSVSKMTFFEQDGVKYYVTNNKKRKKIFYILDSLIKKITGIRRLLTEIFDIRKILLIEKPDIIQAEAVIPYGFIAYCASRITPIEVKIAVSAHLLDGLNIPFEYMERQKGKIFNFISSIVLKNCYLRANSYLTKKWLLNSGGVEDNIVVIPPNIDKDFVGLPKTIKQKNPLKFISVLRYTPVKALDILIPAFGEVVKHFPTAILHIYGQQRHIPGIGDYKTYLNKLIDDKNLSDNIQLLDNIKPKDVPKVISEYDFNICSSHGESLNLVVVEACSVGVPSIVTKFCGISHWVERYKTGIITSCNVESLTQAFTQAAKMDLSAYEALSENCYELIKEFSPTCIANQLSNFYTLVFQTKS